MNCCRQKASAIFLKCRNGIISIILFSYLLGPIYVFYCTLWLNAMQIQKRILETCFTESSFLIQILWNVSNYDRCDSYPFSPVNHTHLLCIFFLILSLVASLLVSDFKHALRSAFYFYFNKFCLFGPLGHTDKQMPKDSLDW